MGTNPRYLILITRVLHKSVYTFPIYSISVKTSLCFLLCTLLRWEHDRHVDSFRGSNVREAQCTLCWQYICHTYEPVQRHSEHVCQHVQAFAHSVSAMQACDGVHPIHHWYVMHVDMCMAVYTLSGLLYLSRGLCQCSQVKGMDRTWHRRWPQTLVSTHKWAGAHQCLYQRFTHLYTCHQCTPPTCVLHPPAGNKCMCDLHDALEGHAVMTCKWWFVSEYVVASTHPWDTLPPPLMEWAYHNTLPSPHTQTMLSVFVSMCQPIHLTLNTLNTQGLVTYPCHPSPCSLCPFGCARQYTSPSPHIAFCIPGDVPASTFDHEHT